MANVTDQGSQIEIWSKPRRAAAGWLGYVLQLAVAVSVFLAVRLAGVGLVGAGAAAEAVASAPAGAMVLPRLLATLAVIVITTRLVASGLERVFGQPPVVGEIVAGVALGPSCLGALAPEWSRLLLPADVLSHLGVLSTLGIVLFMFLVGLELEFQTLRTHARATLNIAHASILVPFTLGALLALFIYPSHSAPGTNFTVFALFIGISLSVTAFPVLVRILEHRQLQATPLGVTAIGCAAIDDATAWCLLAFISGLAKTHLGDAFWTALSTAAFVALLICLRPALRRWVERVDRSMVDSQLPLALVLAAALIAAMATELIGIHALFGAFLFGACLPSQGRLAQRARAALHQLVTVLLLPIFFALTGLRTSLGLLASVYDVALCLAIIAIASLGKFGGSYFAARFQGVPRRDAAALGILMNTRGLMELIVLNVGLEMGVLPQRLFTMLVLMALVTTFATTPLLAKLQSSKVTALGAA